ncbi:MAG: hypothetical protein WCI22_11115 [Actinomycetota bacterium]
MMLTTTVAELHIGGPVDGWQRLGLHIVDDAALVDGVALRFVGGEPGLHGWAFCNAPVTDDLIDGIPTRYVDALTAGGRDHDLSVIAVDHVVVNTSSLERTCAAIEAATGEPLKRVREIGAIRQGFHRLERVVLEVVESPQVTAAVASLWGFVLTVDDIHDACDRLGPDVVGLPKAAVQPGRFIATVRPTVALGLPLAFISPRT